ncbi:MAG: hypothetical protein EOP08_07895 [Proteobacteria bacterium]|nr:MAG: hypothetical protein EOP08_07895 [Pseudomonadota bacterium]
MQSTDLGHRFQRDGFVIQRNVFTQDEVRQLRAAVLERARKAKALGHVFKPSSGECAPAGDLLGVPVLEDLLFDARLLDIARAVVPAKELVYFGDSGIMVGGTNRGFHKDNTCRDDASHPDWQTPYTLVRFGIYLQDHDRWSGGLKVRRGSHLHVDDYTGEIVDIDTRAGDVVLWNMRLTHSGHTVRVRGLPGVHLQPRFEVRAPRSLRVPESEERAAVFMTFGIDDGHLARYLEKHTNLTAYADNYLYKSWLYSAHGEAYESRAKAAGLRLVRPVGDYGSLHGNATPLPEGYVVTGRGKRDVYTPRGTEAAIQRLGSIVRQIGARARALAPSR